MFTIFKGTYRGNKISLTEIPGTDGQVDLLVKVVNKELSDLFEKYITDKKIREFFTLPDENHQDAGLQIANGSEADANIVGFVFRFMLRMLPSTVTNFTYIHSICTSIDKMVNFLLEVEQKEKRINEKEEGVNDAVEAHALEVAVRDDDVVNVIYPNIMVIRRGTQVENGYQVELAPDPGMTAEEADATRGINYTFKQHDLTRGEAIKIPLKEFIEKYLVKPEPPPSEEIPPPCPQEPEPPSPGSEVRDEVKE